MLLLGAPQSMVSGSGVARSTTVPTTLLPCGGRGSGRSGERTATTSARNAGKNGSWGDSFARGDRNEDAGGPSPAPARVGVTKVKKRHQRRGRKGQALSPLGAAVRRRAR